MQKKLMIEGMSCNHCVNHVKEALTEDIDGVVVKEVNLDGKYALVDMDESVSTESISEILEELGFKLKSVE